MLENVWICFKIIKSCSLGGRGSSLFAGVWCFCCINVVVLRGVDRSVRVEEDIGWNGRLFSLGVERGICVIGLGRFFLERERIGNGGC